MVVGKNDETKGFKVLIPSKQVVVTTRHVSRIETLTAESNCQLRRVLESEEEAALEALARERERERGREEQARENSTNATSAPSTDPGRDDTETTRERVRRPASQGATRTSDRRRKRNPNVIFMTTSHKMLCHKMNVRSKRCQGGRRDSARNQQRRLKPTKPTHYRKEQTSRSLLRCSFHPP